MLVSRVRRRGAEAIEFALSLPILLMIMAGIIDFGWFATHQSAVHGAATYGARAGSITPQDQDPLSAAHLAAERALADQRVENAVVNATFVPLGTGEQAIEVQVDAPYSGLWGFVPLPVDYRGLAVRRMNEQPD